MLAVTIMAREMPLPMLKYLSVGYRAQGAWSSLGAAFVKSFCHFDSYSCQQAGQLFSALHTGPDEHDRLDVRLTKSVYELAEISCSSVAFDDEGIRFIATVEAAPVALNE
jgi:hypothetical protein